MGAAGDEAAGDGGGGIAFLLGDFLDALDGFGFEEWAIAECGGWSERRRRRRRCL
jgi:hypothetical protein